VSRARMASGYFVESVSRLWTQIPIQSKTPSNPLLPAP
jgi:hypothetical protein